MINVNERLRAVRPRHGVHPAAADRPTDASRPLLGHGQAHIGVVLEPDSATGTSLFPRHRYQGTLQKRHSTTSRVMMATRTSTLRQSSGIPRGSSPIILRLRKGRAELFQPVLDTARLTLALAFGDWGMRLMVVDAVCATRLLADFPDGEGGGGRRFLAAGARHCSRSALDDLGMQLQLVTALVGTLVVRLAADLLDEEGR